MCSTTRSPVSWQGLQLHLQVKTRTCERHRWSSLSDELLKVMMVRYTKRVFVRIVVSCAGRSSGSGKNKRAPSNMLTPPDVAISSMPRIKDSLELMQDADIVATDELHQDVNVVQCLMTLATSEQRKQLLQTLERCASRYISTKSGCVILRQALYEATDQ